jgi:hypothetical protein
MFWQNKLECLVFKQNKLECLMLKQNKIECFIFQQNKLECLMLKQNKLVLVTGSHFQPSQIFARKTVKERVEFFLTRKF